MPATYTTPRFRLRSIRDSDLPALWRNFSDAQLMEFYDLAPLTSMDEMHELVARWRRWEGKSTGVRWAIARKDTDEAIGTCGLRDIDRGVRCAEAGCELGREYWRQGVIAEIAPFVGHYAFEVLVLDHIKAFIAPENRASIALMGKFGFRKRRLVRDRATVNGRPRDLLYFTLTRAAYRAKVYPHEVRAFDGILFAIHEMGVRLANYLRALSLRRAH